METLQEVHVEYSANCKLGLWNISYHACLKGLVSNPEATFFLYWVQFRPDSSMISPQKEYPVTSFVETQLRKDLEGFQRKHPDHFEELITLLRDLANRTPEILRSHYDGVVRKLGEQLIQPWSLGRR